MTGVGALSPLGATWPATWSALLAGRSGVLRDGSGDLIAPVTAVDPSAALGRRTAARLDRVAQLAVLAAREAVRDAGGGSGRLTPDPARTAVAIGSGLGGAASWENAVATRLQRGPDRVNPYTTATVIPDSAATAVARDQGVHGPCSAPVAACASGALAVAAARDHLLLDRADVVICGAAEAPLTATVLAGFATMRARSRYLGDPRRASRPFDAARDGFVPAEGAAVLVLETASHARARGAQPLGVLLGAATGCDAYHPTAPDPGGAVAEAVVRAALRDADSPRLAYVNAHATATPAGDAVESEILARLVGAAVPVSATKSLTGHLLGASAALEALVCLAALAQRLAPATANLDSPQGPALDHIRVHPRALGPGAALSVSFGFGGHDAALVLGGVPAAAAGPRGTSGANPSG